MKSLDLVERIIDLPVFDTHSHVNAPGKTIQASCFADLGYYFWLSQQLKGVGWEESDTLDMRAATAYFDAFTKTENTAMNWCLRRILLDLYGIQIRSPHDILIADNIIRERSQEASVHIRDVCKKGNIQRVTQNLDTQSRFVDAPELGVLLADTLNQPLNAFNQDPSENGADKTISKLIKIADAMSQQGRKGARIDYNLFETIKNVSRRDAFLKAIFSRFHKNNMFVQIFIGMKRHQRGSFPQNDQTRITELIPFFQEYSKCRFELICAAEGNCLDVVQAAVMNPNVFPGGLWWYAFRPSLFVQAMEQRLEALAPLKCPVLASDATYIEWCYGKSMLVKVIMGKFLSGKVEAGWLSEECSVRTASAWLYDAPAAYYL